MSSLVSSGGSTSTETATTLVPEKGTIGTCSGVLSTGDKCSYTCNSNYSMNAGGSSLVCTDGSYIFEVCGGIWVWGYSRAGNGGCASAVVRNMCVWLKGHAFVPCRTPPRHPHVWPHVRQSSAAPPLFATRMSRTARSATAATQPTPLASRAAARAVCCHWDSAKVMALN